MEMVKLYPDPEYAERFFNLESDHCLSDEIREELKRRIVRSKGGIFYFERDVYQPRGVIAYLTRLLFNERFAQSLAVWNSCTEGMEELEKKYQKKILRILEEISQPWVGFFRREKQELMELEAFIKKREKKEAIELYRSFIEDRGDDPERNQKYAEEFLKMLRY